VSRTTDRRRFLGRCLAGGLLAAVRPGSGILQALAQTPAPWPDNELRAAWLSLCSPADLFCRDGEPGGTPCPEGVARVVSLLDNCGFNALFVMVDSWYGYSAVHPDYEGANPLATWDALGVLLHHAAARGMQVHLSLPLVNHRNYPRGRSPDFSPECGGSRSWRARYLDPGGQLSDSETNVCPSRAETRAWQAALCRGVLQRHASVARVQLEEPGFDDRSFCACDECRRQFHQLHGQDLLLQLHREATFGDCLPERCDARAADLKCAHVTALIQAVRQAVGSRSPTWSATVSVDRWRDRQLGRDWVAWARRGWLDFLAPMIYVAEAGEFRRRLTWGVLRSLDPGVPVCPGIGTHFRGSLAPGPGRARPRINSTSEVAAQIEAARAVGRDSGRVPGVYLFLGELLRPAHRVSGIRYLAELRAGAFRREARVPDRLTTRLQSSVPNGP
jgi:hypothetical protein